MENWNMVALLAALGFNLAAGAWNLVAAIRHDRKAARLDRETYEVRPLMSDEKLAVLRPGDTVLMLPSLDGMTTDQRVAMISSMNAMIEHAKERSIEFIVVPDWGQEIVVFRGGLSEQAEVMKVRADFMGRIIWQPAPEPAQRGAER